MDGAVPKIHIVLIVLAIPSICCHPRKAAVYRG